MSTQHTNPMKRLYTFIILVIIFVILLVFVPRFIVDKRETVNLLKGRELQLNYVWAGEGKTGYTNTIPLKGNLKERTVFEGDPPIWNPSYSLGIYAPFFSTPPIFYNGILYFGDTHGYFYAVNPAEGNVIWKQDVGINEQELNPVFITPPIILDDVVFFGRRNTLIGLDLHTGKFVYKQEINDVPTGHITGIGFQNGNIIVTQVSNLKARSYIFWIEPKTGKIESRFTPTISSTNAITGETVQNAPVTNIEGPLTSNGYALFYNPNFGHMFCFDAKERKLVSQKSQTEQNPESRDWSFCVLNGKVFSTAWSYSSLTVASYDITNGNLIWRVNFEDKIEETLRDLYISRPGYYFNSFIATDGKAVYCGDSFGNIFSVDAATGHLKWQLKSLGFIRGERFANIKPMISRDMLYLIASGEDDSSFVYAIDTETSKILWKHPLSKESVFPVEVADGKIYFEDGLCIKEISN